MDVDNDGISAEEMTRAYDDSPDSESSEEAVSAVSRGGARLDSTGKSISGRTGTSKKLQAEAFFKRPVYDVLWAASPGAVFAVSERE
jgi:hypothetical protein